MKLPESAFVTQSSPSGIASRIVRAAGAQGVNQLARVAQLFLLVPICLTAWGTGVYEDWILLNSVTGFLSLADLGFGQLTTVKLIDAWSKGEHERFSREWAFALGTFAALAAALICLAAISLASPIWPALVGARHLDADETAAVAVLLTLTQVAWMLICVGLALYRARGDLSRSYHVSSILVGLQTAAVAVPAWLGERPWAAAGATCLVTISWLGAVTVDLGRRYPDLNWMPAWPGFGRLSSRLREAVGYLASPVTIAIMSNAPNLILAQIGAPQGAIALFSTTRTVAGVARQLPYQFAHPAGVELASLLARGDQAGLTRVYASASRALAIVVGLLSGFTLVAAPLVMLLWTRGRVGYDAVLMLILVGTTAVCAPAQVAYTLLWYGGYPGVLSKGLLFSTVLATGLATALGSWFGTRGLAMGLGAGEIVGIAGCLSLLVDRLLERRIGTGLLRNFGITLAAFSSSAAFGYLLDRILAPHGWAGLIELSVAWSLPAIAVMGSTLSTRSQRLRLAGMTANFLRPLRPKSSMKNANSADLG
jgi:O-antigen/teichoic acid export membrane protein